MRKRIERLELNSCQFVVLLFYGYRRPAVASGINPPPEIERCSMAWGIRFPRKLPLIFKIVNDKPHYAKVFPIIIIKLNSNCNYGDHICRQWQ